MRSQSGTICNPYQGRKSNRSSLLLIDLHSFKTKQKNKTVPPICDGTVFAYNFLYQ